MLFQHCMHVCIGWVSSHENGWEWELGLFFKSEGFQIVNYCPSLKPCLIKLTYLVQKSIAIRRNITTQSIDRNPFCLKVRSFQAPVFLILFRTYIPYLAKTKHYHQLYSRVTWFCIVTINIKIALWQSRLQRSHIMRNLKEYFLFFLSSHLNNLLS